MSKSDIQRKTVANDKSLLQNFPYGDCGLRKYIRNRRLCIIGIYFTQWLSPILQCRPLIMFPFHILPLLCQEKSNMFVKKKKQI